MELTDENYYSVDADREYMSVSQFKSFLPMYGGCEAKAIAQIKSIYKQQDKTALLVGNYVHSYFESIESHEKFKKDNPDILTKKGELKAQYKQADDMINCLKTDESFNQIYQGEKEKIFTGELFGVPWKIKVDCFNEKENYFVDLKTVRDFERQWVHDEIEDKNKKISFVEAWGYIVQIAVYREIISKSINNTKDDLEGFIVAVTKQSPPDKAALYFKPQDYELGLQIVAENVEHIMDLKSGRIQPHRCGKCDYCRATKKLNRAIHYSEL